MTVVAISLDISESRSTILLFDPKSVGQALFTLHVNSFLQIVCEEGELRKVLPTGKSLPQSNGIAIQLQSIPWT